MCLEVAGKAVNIPRNQRINCLRALFRPGRYSHVLIDADDTIWYDGRYFRNLRGVLLRLTADMGMSGDTVLAELTKAMNIEPPGEGGYASAIIRTAHQLGLRNDSMGHLEDAVNRFREHPIVLLPAARASIVKMRVYCRILLTKGSRVEQMRKLGLSGIAECFDEIVVIDRKSVDAVYDICARRCIDSSQVLVIGNSVRHDIIPAIKIGAGAIWLNHNENEHGRNDAPPPGTCEVEGWEVVLEALQSREQGESNGRV